MSSSYNNLSDDWGWFIDLESMTPIHQLNKACINQLEIIDEEYEYYTNNQIDSDYVSSTTSDKIIDNKSNINSFNVIIKITIATILSYFIVFIL